MTILSSCLNSIGLVLLVHAAYSSYEHSLLTTSSLSSASSSHTLGAKEAQTSQPHSSSSSSSSSSSPTSVTALPTDIVVETLVSTILLVLGIVLGSARLRPIEWAVWANEVEQDARRPRGSKRFEGDGGAEGSTLAWLDDRKGFWDVAKKRREFAIWIKEGGKKDLNQS